MAAMDVDEKELTQEEKWFLYVVDQGCDHEVKKSIESGVDVNVSDRHNLAALWNAARHGYTTIVKILIESGAKIDYCGIRYFMNTLSFFSPSPLYVAVLKNNIDVVKLLVAAKANMNITDMHSRTPLVCAISNRLKDVACLLIDSGADVDMASKSGYTPLFHAVKNEMYEVVQKLLEKGANIHKYFGYSTLLSLAMTIRNEDIAILLIKHGADIEQLSGHLQSTPLKMACDKNLKRVVVCLVNAGVDINRRSCANFTAIHFTIDENMIDLLILLISLGADVNNIPDTGITPLMTACLSGNEKLVKILLSSSAKPFIQFVNGKTARDMIPKDKRQTIGKLFRNSSFVLGTMCFMRSRIRMFHEEYGLVVKK